MKCFPRGGMAEDKIEGFAGWSDARHRGYAQYQLLAMSTPSVGEQPLGGPLPPSPGFPLDRLF